MSNAWRHHTPRIFISHNGADNDLGHRFMRDLRAMYGEDAVWYDSRGGILPGDPWPERIQLELTDRDTFLILLSPDSVASPWVRDEINMAWQQQSSSRGKVIIPLLVRPCDIPLSLATIQYVSFLPDPKHPYELAFTQLLDAIRHAKTRFREIQSMPLIPQGGASLNELEGFYQRNLDSLWTAGDWQGEGDALADLGHAAWQRGMLEEARTYFMQALAIGFEVQDRRVEGAVLHTLGQIAQRRGQLDAADSYFRQALVILREVSDRQGEGVTLSSLGQIAQQRDQLDAADSYLQQSLAIRREVSDRQGEGVDLSSLGQIAQQRDQLDAADSYFRQSLAIRREVSDRQGEGVDLAQLAALAEMRDDFPQALHLYRQALDALRESEDAINYASVAHSFGALLLAHGGDVERAEGCTLLAEALHLFEQSGVPGADDVRATAAKFACDIEQ